MAEPRDVWNAVDDWVEGRFVPEDAALEGALAASTAAGLPAIQVSAAQGRLLELLVRISGARSVLEVGTLGGYSTIWLAPGVPRGGRPAAAALARGPRAAAPPPPRAPAPPPAAPPGPTPAAAGVADLVEVRVGP